MLVIVLRDGVNITQNKISCVNLVFFKYDRTNVMH